MNAAPSRPQTAPNTLYALRRGFGLWELTFGGRTAILRDEQGLRYVACLLSRGSAEPIPAVDLLGLAAGLRASAPSGGGWLPGSGEQETVVQRSSRFDDRETLKGLAGRLRELQVILDDDNEIEPVKAEARVEFEQLSALRHRRVLRTADQAQLAMDGINKTLRRFCRRLATARDARGRPHPVLREFSEHLENCLLLPARRFLGSKQKYRGGSYDYRPEPPIRWVVE